MKRINWQNLLALGTAGLFMSALVGCLGMGDATSSSSQSALQAGKHALDTTQVKCDDDEEGIDDEKDADEEGDLANDDKEDQDSADVQGCDDDDGTGDDKEVSDGDKDDGDLDVSGGHDDKDSDDDDDGDVEEVAVK